MKAKHKKFVPVLFLLIFATLTACTNTKQSHDDLHLQTAEMHERTAKDYRTRGIDYMADYYNEEAQKERHAVVNSGCDLFDITLAIITLGILGCG